MNPTTLKLLEAAEKANRNYANVRDRLRAVTREAAIARKASKAAQRAFINAITKEQSK